MRTGSPCDGFLLAECFKTAAIAAWLKYLEISLICVLNQPLKVLRVALDEDEGAAP